MKSTIHQKISWGIAWACCFLVAVEMLLDVAEKWFWPDSIAERIVLAIVISVVAAFATMQVMLELWPKKH